MAKEAPVRAVVTDVCGQGKKRYVVSRTESNSQVITFSLRVWEGESEPKPRQVVELFRVEEFAHGWRAQVAKPVSFKQQ